MITVAVAGGTGGIGKTIVEELARQGKYKVLVLSRKVPLLQTLDGSGTAHYIRPLLSLILLFPYLPRTMATHRA
jgi:NAD(P)-dependent dehydrogenase (short-subunit alcohol dehydrogenase family)